MINVYQSAIGYGIRMLYYVLMIYYLLIAIYFLMTWIRPLYGTMIFRIFEAITRPFMSLCSGKLIVGMFDLGATIGMVVYAVLLYVLQNLSNIL